MEERGQMCDMLDTVCSLSWASEKRHGDICEELLIKTQSHDTSIGTHMATISKNWRSLCF